MPSWATRDLRPGEGRDLPREMTLPIFYPWTDGPRRRGTGMWRYLKGVEHGLGLARLLRSEARRRADIVHFQWAVLPMLDRLAIGRLRRTCPVVLTVHDVTPFNGRDVPLAQRRGFAQVLDSVDRMIVHTPGARDALAAAGHAPARIDLVPHGLLRLPPGVRERGDGRWRIVQFGRIQHYKGVDLLLEALGTLDAATRARLEIVVAGEPMVETGPLLARASELGLEGIVDFRFGHLSEGAMAELLASADAFVFPYRTIEASGVLFLVASLGRWIVASDRGAFPDLLGRDGAAGALVDPEDPTRLAEALQASIGLTPRRSIVADVPSWEEIGRMTRAVYERALADRGQRRRG